MQRRPVNPQLMRSSYGLTLGVSIVVILLGAGLILLGAWQDLTWLLLVACALVVLGITLVAYSAASFAAWGAPDPIAALRSNVRTRKVIILIGFVIAAVPLAATMFTLPSTMPETPSLAIALAVVMGVLVAVLVVSAAILFVRPEKYPALLPR